jgi:hypothetical protein
MTPGLHGYANLNPESNVHPAGLNTTSASNMTTGSNMTGAAGNTTAAHGTSIPTTHPAGLSDSRGGVAVGDGSDSNGGGIGDPGNPR